MGVGCRHLHRRVLQQVCRTAGQSGGHQAAHLPLCFTPLRSPARPAAVSSPTKRQKAANAAAMAAKEAELSERLEANMNELVKLSDEKLNIATQASRCCCGAALQLVCRFTGHRCPLCCIDDCLG